MDYRVLTVNREFGSGGGQIAQTIAERLSWKLLDRYIIDAIAYEAHVESSVVRQYDEHVESWLRRFNHQAMRAAALTAGLRLGDNSVFDAEETVRLTEKIVEQAHAEGNCVIVGRGAQCILHDKPDVFRVFVYAPYMERVERLRKRLGEGTDIEQRIRTVDAERIKYLQDVFGTFWANPHLYDLMIRSHVDEELAVGVILHAMTGQA